MNQFELKDLRYPTKSTKLSPMKDSLNAIANEVFWMKHGVLDGRIDPEQIVPKCKPEDLDGGITVEIKSAIKGHVMIRILGEKQYRYHDDDNGVRHEWSYFDSSATVILPRCKYGNFPDGYRLTGQIPVNMSFNKLAKIVEYVYEKCREMGIIKSNGTTS